jgi:pantothenate kinase
MIAAFVYCLKHGEGILQTFDTETQEMKTEEAPRTEFPKLLAYYGTASIIMRVNEDQSFDCVAKSSLTGGSLRGLAHALTGVENFEELITLANNGSTKGVDKLFEEVNGPDLFPEVNGMSLG